jgi:hypothetical protein
VEWTFDYRGEGDKIVYTAVGNTVTRQVFSGGQPASKPVKVQLKEQPGFYQFIFDISPTRISLRDNGHNLLDEFTRTDSSVDLGKIGFRGDISIFLEQLR